MLDEYVCARPEWNLSGGDHDLPYRFGRHPVVYLTAREFARLLVFRGRLAELVARS